MSAKSGHRLAGALDVEPDGGRGRDLAESTAAGSGTASGGTRYSCSSATWSGTRLVARIWSAGAASSSAATSRERRRQVLEVVDDDEHARASASARASVAIGDSPAPRRSPSRAAMLGMTSAGVRDGRQVDERRAADASAAAASARVVFPVPPGPVSVTSRVSHARGAP